MWPEYHTMQQRNQEKRSEEKFVCRSMEKHSLWFKVMNAMTELGTLQETPLRKRRKTIDTICDFYFDDMWNENFIKIKMNPLMWFWEVNFRIKLLSLYASISDRFKIYTNIIFKIFTIGNCNDVKMLWQENKVS